MLLQKIRLLQEPQADSQQDTQSPPPYEFLRGIYSCGDFAIATGALNENFITGLMASVDGTLPGVPQEWQGYTPQARCDCDQILTTQLCTKKAFDNKQEHDVPHFVRTPGW